jgi:D-glycero-D-manno-heptose 1,7-bisphosphate phosphatase
VSSTKLIILDRDGVINFDSADYIKSPAEWHPIPGSLEAIAKLHQAGYQIAVATNQSGIGRGYYDLATLAAIHEKMLNAVRQLGGEIHGIFYCPQLPDANCDCRKPKPGLLYQIRDYFQYDLANVWSVGDSKRDLQAATAVKAQPVLVKTGNGAALLQKEKLAPPIKVFDDLCEVVNTLLRLDT